ncbi:hypothetical protein D3C84_1305530 [compost metagenome]
MLVGQVGNHQGGGDQRGPLQGEQVDQGQDAPLRDHGESQYQQPGREEIDALGQ